MNCKDEGNTLQGTRELEKYYTVMLTISRLMCLCVFPATFTQHSAKDDLWCIFLLIKKD